MGCDIHIFVERKGESGWKAVKEKKSFNRFLS